MKDLDNISFEEKGNILIVGPEGAGKSTLIKRYLEEGGQGGDDQYVPTNIAEIHEKVEEINNESVLLRLNDIPGGVKLPKKQKATNRGEWTSKLEISDEVKHERKQEKERKQKLESEQEFKKDQEIKRKQLNSLSLKTATLMNTHLGEMNTYTDSNVEAIILVVPATPEKKIENLQKWKSVLEEKNGIPVILLITKIDLLNLEEKGDFDVFHRKVEVEAQNLNIFSSSIFYSWNQNSTIHSYNSADFSQKSYDLKDLFKNLAKKIFYSKKKNEFEELLEIFDDNNKKKFEGHLEFLQSKIDEGLEEIVKENEIFPALNKEEQSFDKIKDSKPKITLSNFKYVYYKTYDSVFFFKDPFSKMKRLLGANEITNMSDVEKYAKDNPKSRTAKILKEYKENNPNSKTIRILKSLSS